jgi:hypothetical protein
MAEDVPDAGRSDTPLMLPLPNGNLNAQSHDDDFDEVMETVERKQKILAKIICVPGEKTYVAKWMKQTYEILLEADPQASIVTPSGLKITSMTDFPSGKKFQTAFLPTKINMNFQLTLAPALKKIKAKHRRLVDPLQKH